MLSIAKQMYDYYVKPYLGEKGQDMVEYALMLVLSLVLAGSFTARLVLQVRLTMYSTMQVILWIRLHPAVRVSDLLKQGRFKFKELLLWQEFFGKAASQ